MKTATSFAADGRKNLYFFHCLLDGEQFSLPLTAFPVFATS